MNAVAGSVVEQTREAFLQIGSSVEDITGRIEQITAVPEQTSAPAEQIATSALELSGNAETLKQADGERVCLRAGDSEQLRQTEPEVGAGVNQTGITLPHRPPITMCRAVGLSLYASIN